MVLIIAVTLFLIVIRVVLDQDLKVLKEKKYHDAIQQSRFMRMMDRLINDFFTWRRWKTILPVGLLVMAILMLVSYLFIRYTLPHIPPLADIAIDHNDPALYKRGQYLVENVATCTDCHSPRNPRFYSWPLIEEQMCKRSQC